MSREETVQRLRRSGLVAIVRADGDLASATADAVAALVDGGIEAVELTLTTPGALDALAALSARFGEKLLLGLGSVLDPASVAPAVAAGASFFVTPVVRPAVVAACREAGKAVACGAFTPTEALAAHESGADFVKVFPAGEVGPNYIKAMRGPLPQLQIIPTGGVTLQTVKAFLDAGCAALAVGSNLVSADVLRARDWARLRKEAAAYVAAVAEARKK